MDPKRAANESRGVEAIALALIASLPVTPYLVFLLDEGVARFALAGDFALLEQATRHVWSGDTLLGPYSRFRWHHPGPLFFFVVAPFQALFGKASTGLFVGTCFINVAAASTLVVMTRLWASRAHALASVAALVAWFTAFGNVTPNPWNPLVIVVPLITFLVAAAFVARGESRAAAPAALFGLLAVSNHVAAVSIVAIAGVASLASFALVRRKGIDRRAFFHLSAAAAVVLIALVPPLLEQARAPEGNLTAVVRFFLHRDAPLKPSSTALRNLVIATSWLPDRLLSLSLRDEGWVALGMRWDPLPETISRTAMTTQVVHWLAAASAAIIAARRRDSTSLAILVFGVIGEAVAFSALRRIVGDDLHYLVFWVTAPSTVVWLGAASALSGFAAERVRALRQKAPATAIIALLAAGVATSLQRGWLEKIGGIPGSYPGMRPLLRELHTTLVQRLERDAATPVVHSEGAYDIAQATVLELEKDGFDVRVPTVDRWSYFGLRSPDSVERPLHVWFSRPEQPPPLDAACIELLREHAPISMFVANEDDPNCKAR